jgi:thymidine kinase
MSRLTFYYSSMNSGKSLAVLTKNYMLQEKGFRTVLMKPAVDTRTANTISTRLGIEQCCVVIAPDTLPSSYILKSSSDKPDFVLVDEAQFLSECQIWDLSDLVDHWNINVICYGLRLDWQGNFFTGSGVLFKIADELHAIENLCKHNRGAPAYFHVKLGGSDHAVEVGAEDLYESVSRKHWRQWWHNRNQPL